MDTYAYNRSVRIRPSYMIKKHREKKRVQSVLRALLSPPKELRRAMATPSKGQTPGSEIRTKRRMGSLGLAPSPCTPADVDDHDLMTPTAAARQTPKHVPGLTPELRAALPTKPLTQWSEADVAACLKVLGRDIAREGTNSAYDVSAFDSYAETFMARGIDGAKFASISIPQLNHELGVSSFNHRLKIVSWIKTYLEVRERAREERVSHQNQNQSAEADGSHTTRAAYRAKYEEYCAGIIQYTLVE